MKCPILLMTLLALSLCGCKTSLKPTPPAVLSHGVSVEERSTDFYKTLPRPIRPDAYRPRVDYQSELRIIVNTNGLFKEITPAASVLPPLTPEQQTCLNNLSGLLQAAQDFVQVLSRSGPVLDAAMNAPVTPDSQQRLLALIQTEARSETNLLQRALDYGTVRIREANPTFNNSQVIKARDALFKPFIHFYPKQRISIDLVQFSAFIATERDVIVRQASEHARAVRDAGSVFLRLRATLLPEGQAEVPLHILHYDTLTDANVAQEPRVSFQMSDEDRKRLAAETQVNTEIAQLSRDLQNGKSEIRQSLDSLLTAARGDLAGWQDAATNFDKLEQKLEPLVAALDQAKASAQLSADQKKVVADARELLATVTNQVQRVRDTINLFVRPIDPNTEPAATLMTTVDALSRGLDGLVNFPADLATKVSRTLDDLQKLVAEIQAAIPQDAPHLQDLADVFKTGAPASTGAITNLLVVTLGNYPALVAELGSLRRKSQIVAAASTLPPIQIDTNLLDIAVANPPDGFISLRKNVVRGDATVTLDAALVMRQDAAAAPGAKPVAHQEFAVEKFGLINTWSASLIFVERVGKLDATERKVQFAPAPSISWTLHYNPPPDPSVDFQSRNKFLELVDPGAGLNVAALNWSSGVQLGLGAHVSLFHDLLSVGAGYNLNESRHGSYVFIGLGLFQALNQLGITGANFPLGR